jgi:transcriptional regulator with XRE-family HTH domain
MPSTSPTLSPPRAESLVALGQKVRARRKEMRISAVAAAEAAGISRVTLHRVEKGEPSVTAGAYLAACAAVGLHMDVIPDRAGQAAPAADRKGWIPARVRTADYPVLKQLAWQAHGASELTPREALGIYERNWRHVDANKVPQHEQDLIDSLREAFKGDADV